MNTFRKKLLTAICMVAFSVSFAIAQTNTIKHTVDRGETLQSIAKRYATTEAKIIELNPDAAQFLYVGMELTIPAVKVNEPVKEDNPKTTHNDYDEHNNYNHAPINENFNTQNFSRWSYGMSFGYGFMPTEDADDVSGHNFTYSMSFGANYNVNHSLYVGARLGYATSNINLMLHTDIAQHQNIITNNHYIILPIEVGYKLHLNEDKIMLIPFAGIDINYVVKSTTETGLGSNKKKESNDPDNRLGVNGRLGLKLSLFGFYIGGSYIFSFDDNYGQNNGYPEISIGFGF